MKLSKEDTKVMKGVALWMMFAHHLFPFQDRIAPGNEFLPLIKIGSTNLAYIIGHAGKLCVAIYLFLSGYGLYFTIIKNGRFSIGDVFKRLKKLYINYWVILFIFVPIGFAMGVKVFNMKEFMGNFFAYKLTYNGEWWFLKLYIQLIIVFPIMNKIICKNPWVSFAIIFIFSRLGETVTLVVNANPNLVFLNSNDIYLDFISLLHWQPIFFMGCLFAKFNLFNEMNKIFKKIKLHNRLVYIAILVLIVAIRFKMADLTFKSMRYDYLFAPIYVYVTINILKGKNIRRIFVFLGNHSTNMWLTHSFLCYQYIQSIVYRPKLPILIMVWLTILLIPISFGINKIISMIQIIESKIVKKFYEFKNAEIEA
ncbi:acyltransferase [uncultured Clostridium sp.]|uniref:acyltransferase family protein n=1 Tax=uncultured Clostridium sp. TaxID=59620 RepID=UPI0025E099A5|nr:acyltransferase [uncultured Clostridium sp.]